MSQYFNNIGTRTNVHLKKIIFYKIKMKKRVFTRTYKRNV